MSKLSESLIKLGFDSEEKQKALIENLYLAGYLKPESIWQALNSMQYDKSGKEVFRWKQGLERSFDNIILSLKTSGAYQENPEEFKADKFIESFMEDGFFFDDQNISDMMLFLAQNAFGRSALQERSELARQEWSDVHKAKYLENTKILGVFDEINPACAKHDETWIQGAARLRTKTRMTSAKKYQDHGVDLGAVRLLTGERELWVEIDKLPNESTQQCMEFMLKLVHDNGIKIEGFEERVVAGNKRTYPKYVEGETKKLTETLMAKAIYREVFGADLREEQLVDSSALEGELRPNTASNAVDVTRQQLIARVRNGDFEGRAAEILIISNQPYVDRQVLTNKRAVRSELEKQGVDYPLNFSGAGDICEVGVTAIHSELAALVNEGYNDALERGLMPNADRENTARLTFQNRCKEKARELRCPAVDFTKVVAPKSVQQLSGQEQSAVLQ